MNPVLRLLLAACAATALGACSSPAAETPPPPPAGTAEPDIAKYVEAPCDVLEPEQVTALGAVKEPKAEKTANGSLCAYEGADAAKDSTYRIEFITQGGGYDELVEERRAHPIFSQSTSSGVAITTSDRVNGLSSCDTVIRASGGAAVVVAISVPGEAAPDYGAACKATEEVTDTVVANLKG